MTNNNSKKRIYSPLHAAYADAAGYIAASFLYFLSLVLYMWSTPPWFSSFPRASAFRFIFAVGVYCQCSMLFLYGLSSREKDVFDLLYRGRTAGHEISSRLRYEIQDEKDSEKTFP